VNDQQLTAIYIRIRDGVGLLLQKVPQILGDPRAYPQEAMLLALMSVLVLVFVILLVYTLYGSVEHAYLQRKVGLRVKKRGQLRRALATLAVVGVVLWALSVVPMLRATSPACGNCHQIKSSVDSWKQSVHASVSCYGCHAQPGPLGASAATIAGLTRVALTPRVARADTLAYSVAVQSSGCLHCHGKIRSGVQDKTVRMRHSDVIAAGISCLRCHPNVGHVSIDRTGARQQPVTRSTMSICLTCHDGVKAPSQCDECHGGHPLDQAAGRGYSFGQLATPLRCVGCHTKATSQKCLACHGIELPHPATFMRTHAGRSFRDPGLCARCHAEAAAAVSCGCHNDQNLHGTYTDWFPRHGPQAAQVGRYGCNCHGLDFCAKCHDTNPFTLPAPSTVSTAGLGLPSTAPVP
jgi:hypothetical protein